MWFRQGGAWSGLDEVALLVHERRSHDKQLCGYTNRTRGADSDCLGHRTTIVVTLRNHSGMHRIT